MLRCFGRAIFLYISVFAMPLTLADSQQIILYCNLFLFDTIGSLPSMHKPHFVRFCKWKQIGVFDIFEPLQPV